MSLGHPQEQHQGDIGPRLNWLRAGVLGANDGIVSTAGIVIGVAGASGSVVAIATAGIAGLVAGSLAMAGGEYVSVSAQLDSEKAALAKERWELANLPEHELDELAQFYVDKGIRPELARQVAEDLTAKDAFRAHADAELGINPDALTNPWAAALSSLVSFAAGALIPLAAILLPPGDWRVWVCVIAVALGLLITGLLSARLGGAPRLKAVLRNVGMGLITMAVTYAVGRLFGTAIA